MSSPEQFPRKGLYHVFSNPVSKYEMLQVFKEKFGINCVIEKDEVPKLNRTMDSIHEVNKKLNIPSFKEMVEAL
jgi:dTDP-4-dehydrorhamnose reductase